MRQVAPGGTAPEGPDRKLPAVASYVLWLVSAAVGLVGIFAIHNLAKLILALTLGRSGDEASKWSGPALIAITGVSGVALLVLLLIWEDRYRRDSEQGLQPLLRRFRRVTVGEAIVVVAAVALWLALLRFGV